MEVLLFGLRVLDWLETRKNGVTHRFFSLDSNIARRLEHHDCAVYMYERHGRNGSEPHTKKLRLRRNYISMLVRLAWSTCEH
jgi:hypothetical protein